MNLFEVQIHDGTDPALKPVLMDCLVQRQSVRIWYGDTKTGAVWPEEWDVVGRIGKSTGSIKILLLVPIGDNGGPSLLEHCIVRIAETQTGEVLYEHPLYHQPEYTIQPCHLEVYDKVYRTEVLLDGEVHARFEEEWQAKRWIAFMKGERFNK